MLFFCRRYTVGTSWWCFSFHVCKENVAISCKLGSSGIAHASSSLILCVCVRMNHYVYTQTHANTHSARCSLSLHLVALARQRHTNIVSHMCARTHTHLVSATSLPRVFLWEACLVPNCEALLIKALLLSSGLLWWSDTLPVTFSPPHTLCHTLTTAIHVPFLCSLSLIHTWNQSIWIWLMPVSICVHIQH